MMCYLTKAKRFIAHLIAGAAVLFIVACTPQEGGVSNETANTREGDLNTVQVALLLPYSSPNAQVVTLAEAAENAARLAMADLEGTITVTLKTYDTGGSAATSTAAAVQAASEGAEIIIGPLYGEASNAAGSAVAGQGIPVLSLSNNTEIAGGNVYVLGNTFQNAANRLADYSLMQGKKRSMILHAKNLGGFAARSAVEKALAARGAAPVAISDYEFTQQGVIDAMPIAAAATDETGADVVFLTADFDGALAPIAQLLPEMGVNPATVQYAGLARWDVLPSAYNFPGIQGGWFTVPDPHRVDQFNIRYKSAYSRVPHPIAVIAYDAMAAIGALAATGDKHAFSKRSLTRSSGFQGANGIFRLKSDGTNQRGVAIASIIGKDVTIIDPAPERFAFGGL